MKSYLITDPNMYTNNARSFSHKLQETIDKNTIDYICFRDKVSCNYESLAQIYVHICKKNNIQNIFINQYINLASSLNVTGVHLTSKQIDKIRYCRKLNLKVIISCHTKEDIEDAIKNDADYITYSPIFESPNKGDAKGLEDLIDVVEKYNNLKIFALGGIIDEEHISLVKNTNVYGYASIRGFI